MIQENHHYDYDVAVIGAGPGGTEVARILGGHGKKVVLFEGEQLGGTCLNRGCIPAKTMLYMAELYRELSKMKDYGIFVEFDSVKIDYTAMVNKRFQIIERLKKDLASQLKNDNVELKEAYASLIDPHTLQYDHGKRVTADSVVLATGGRARKFPGFRDDQRFLTSDNIFALKEIPKSLAVVGAGPVGVEFASFYRAFGAEVYVIELLDRFLGAFDRKLGKALQKIFESQGMQCYVNTKIEHITNHSEKLCLELSKAKPIEVDYVLSAIGVQVNTDYLKLTDLAVDHSGRVVVNENFQTTIPNVYALGDLIGKSGSAYGAEREGRYIAYQLLGLDTNLIPVNYTMMPDVVFTHPEVATCGYGSDELIQKGIKYRIKTLPFTVNAKATVKGEKQGTIWMYIEEETEKILGVHIIGAQATEIIHNVPIVLMHEMTVNDYLKMVWGHPVMAEIIKDNLMLGSES